MASDDVCEPDATGAHPSSGSVAVVFGGGGGFGFGFDRGVADGLIDGGFNLFERPILGTSAGAITAASLLCGLAFDEVASVWDEVVRTYQRRWRMPAVLLTDPLFSGADPSRFAAPLRTVAVRLPRYRRVVMHTDDFTVSDMVAASCSVPPVVRTHVIDGVRYADGGLVSGTSADLAPDADRLMCITPIARPVPGVIGRFGTWNVRRELRKWEMRANAVAVHIPPTEMIASMFRANVTEIGNIDVGRRVYDLSREYGQRLAREWSDLER